ncbi:DUF485 domain-containing protein [Amaricoccus sp. W119]|uniref:DUF485 domain-containing protein n=1 Tax=Amaricoccus sp. W119 TaxID=3391833 RepID=UPI0039A6696C
MTNDQYERVGRDPEFVRIAAARGRLAWLLFAVTMAIFLFLLVLVAFFPGVLATPLGAGRVTTVAWPLGAAAIVIPWLCTVVYVRRANADGVAMNNVVRRVLA